MLAAFTGSQVLLVRGEGPRLKRLLGHIDRMYSCLALGLIRRRRRRRVHRKISRLRAKVYSIVTGVHTTIIRCLLRDVRRSNGAARLVILMPRLDVASMHRRGSVLSATSRRLLGCLRHGDLIDRLQAEVDALPNVILRSKGVCEEWTSRQCALCGHINTVGASKYIVCGGESCPSQGAALCRDSLASVGIRGRFVFRDTPQEATVAAAESRGQAAQSGGTAASSSSSSSRSGRHASLGSEVIDNGAAIGGGAAAISTSKQVSPSGGRAGDGRTPCGKRGRRVR